MANGFADFEYFIFGEISDRFYGIKQYVYKLPSDFFLHILVNLYAVIILTCVNARSKYPN